MRILCALDLLFLFVIATAVVSCNRGSSGPGFVQSATAVPTEELVFISDRDGNDEIYSATIVAGVMTVTRLTNTPEDEAEPAWSSDGLLIAYRADTTPLDGVENPTLFVMNDDGTGVTPLTTLADTMADRAPHWSSTGSKLVFSRVDPLTFNQMVAVMDYPALTTSYVFNGVDPILGYDPQWGPGDLTILFAARVMGGDNNSDIFSVDAAGGVPLQLTNSPGFNDFTPVYYAAENLIAYVEWQGVVPDPLTESVLRSMQLDGTGTAVLHDVIGHSPDWPSGAGGTLYFSLYDGSTEQVWKVDSPGVQSEVDLGAGDNFEPSVKGG